MDNDKRFQEIKEKEIKRLTTPVSYSKLSTLGMGMFFRPRDCEGNPLTFENHSKGKYILEPKPGILSDDEILMYAPESKAASEIRLKKGRGSQTDKTKINKNLKIVLNYAVSFIFIIGMLSIVFHSLICLILLFISIAMTIGYYYYVMYGKDYTNPEYKHDTEANNIKKVEVSTNDDLLLLFQSKEKIAREMIEKRFPAPQITNTKFNAVLDNCKEVVEAQIEMLNVLTPTEKTSYEIESRKNLIKQVISKVDDLTNELILSEENNIENVIDEMDDLINSIKDYE